MCVRCLAAGAGVLNPVEIAEIDLALVDGDVGVPTLGFIMPTNTLDAGLTIATNLRVLPVINRLNVSQVFNTVVRSVSIDMVDDA